jgi:hypothetical protein
MCFENSGLLGTLYPEQKCDTSGFAARYRREQSCLKSPVYESRNPSRFGQVNFPLVVSVPGQCRLYPTHLTQVEGAKPVLLAPFDQFTFFTRHVLLLSLFSPTHLPVFPAD